MRISAKEDYALRAAVELAAAAPDVLKRDLIASAQDIPAAFLETILLELKRAEIVEAQRGPEGGFRLARDADDISVADVIRAVSGPLATVRGVRPPALEYEGAAVDVPKLWIALRASIRGVLETVTLADLAGGKLPTRIRRLAEDPAHWE
jgi:Rrf2 family protein